MADPEDAVNVIKFDPLFSPFPERNVTVVDPGSVIDFVPPVTVKRFNVKAPVIMTAPEPPPVIAILKSVIPPLATVFEVAEVFVTANVELPALSVKFVVVAVVHTVPVELTVHWPVPIVIVLTVVLLELNIPVVKLKPLALSVPLFKVNVFVVKNASCSVIVPPNMFIDPLAPAKEFPADVNVKEPRPSIIYVAVTLNVIAEINVIEPCHIWLVVDITNVGLPVAPVQSIDPPICGISLVTVWLALNALSKKKHCLEGAARG